MSFYVCYYVYFVITILQEMDLVPKSIKWPSDGLSTVVHACSLNESWVGMMSPTSGWETCASPAALFVSADHENVDECEVQASDGVCKSRRP